MTLNVNKYSASKRNFIKKTFLSLLLVLFSFPSFSQEKYFDRNQLPQLNKEILDLSKFSYEEEIVQANLISPVQTQRVRVFQLTAKYKMILLNNEYDPLIIDNNNYLIDGHHRLDGIKELKIKEVRVLRVNATIEEVIEAFDEYRDFTPTYEPEKE